MRVRYGKPIKVKSLLGKQNIPTTISSIGGGYSYVAKTDNSFLGGWGSSLRTNDNCRRINLTSGHKYFLYMSVNMVNSTTNQYDSAYFITVPEGEIKSSGGTNVLLSNKYSATLITPSSDITAIPGIGNYYQKWTVGDVINYMIVLDLTDIFGTGNEPTLSNFYNKYNKYFPLIATGEEITIDDKAGQIAYKNLEEDSIRCKIAGGSSDIYYGYNQRLNSAAGGNRYANECSLSYNETNNEFTITASSATLHTYFGLGCANLAAIQNHKALCMAKITEISISDTFSDISFSWALSNITDRHNVTTAEDWVYAIGTWGSTKTANYLSISRRSDTFTQGDYFKIKDVQIIDLTDWYGPGKEPSTLAEFKEKFSKDYYGFCPTSIKLTRYQIEALPNYGYNQLIKNGNFIDTSSWNGTNGTISASNNILTYTVTTKGSDYGSNRINQSCSHIQNHKYLIGVTTNCPYDTTIRTYIDGYNVLGTSLANTWTTLEVIVDKTGSSTGNGNLYFDVKNQPSYAVNDKIQVKNYYKIDLTDWYGAGSEPTTVEEFKATFPNKYYPYSKKRLLNKYMINKLVN